MSLESLLATARELNPELAKLNERAVALETTVERIDQIGTLAPLPGAPPSGAQPLPGGDRGFVAGIVNALRELPTKIAGALRVGRSEGAGGGGGGFTGGGAGGAVGGLVSGRGLGGGAAGSVPPRFQPGPPVLRGGVNFGTGPGSGVGAQRITAGDQLVANQIAGLRDDIRASSRESASARASR